MRALARDLQRAAGTASKNSIDEKIASWTRAAGVDDITTSDALNGSGLLLLRANRTTIVVNASEHLVRRHWTICHELGHLVLRSDHHAAGRGTHEISCSTEIERRCDLFATELLLPVLALKRELSGKPLPLAPEIPRIARQFGVSTTALVRRIDEIGVMRGSRAALMLAESRGPADRAWRLLAVAADRAAGLVPLVPSLERTNLAPPDDWDGRPRVLRSARTGVRLAASFGTAIRSGQVWWVALRQDRSRLLVEFRP